MKVADGWTKSARDLFAFQSLQLCLAAADDHEQAIREMPRVSEGALPQRVRLLRSTALDPTDTTILLATSSTPE